MHITDKTIVVWFSCGAASAVAAKLTIEKYGGDNTIRIVNNPIAEEDVDNRRFLLDVEEWLGLPVETATHPDWPSNSAVDIWEWKQYMSGIHGAPCTMYLKKHARYHWEENNHADWNVLGFTLEEVGRHDRFVLNERDNVIPVLIDAKLTKADCYMHLLDAGLKLPRIYTEKGYPNANCIGCVKATSPTYWNHVRKEDPEVFKQRADQSLAIGAKLVRYKGERIQLHELPPDAVGRPMKTMNIECGIFCEEREF